MANLVLPTSYSALPRESSNERSRSWVLARIVLATTLLGCALVALMATQSQSETRAMEMLSASQSVEAKSGHLQSLIQPTSESGTAGTGSASSAGTVPPHVPAAVTATVQRPSAQDVAAFESKAGEVLQSIGLNMDNVEEKTGLDETCADMLMPCVATVGDCVKQYVQEENGRLVVDPAACQCFSEGIVKAIPFASLPDARLSCSYGCLEAISDAFDEHLFDANGDADASVACPRTFMNLARQVYGAIGDGFPVADSADGEVVEAVQSTRVVTAAKALTEHINLVRKSECSLKPQYSGDAEVLFDERGLAKDALGQYRLEIKLGADVYTGRIVHLPKTDQMAEAPSADDPDLLLTRFRVMRMSPDPCADGAAAQLAVTQASVDHINTQQLAWRAALKPKMVGRTVAKMGMGNIELSHDVKEAHTIKLAGLDAFQPPPAFDARDHYADQTPCRAYQVLDQGSCGSCYAFAAASALSGRMCKVTDGRWNVVLSPQEMMDCNNGCNGGSAYWVYDHLAGEATTVENFCDPYQQESDVCGDACADGNAFDALADTVYIVGQGDDAVKAMQKELMTNGPGAVSFDVFQDFFSYDGGVYTKTAGPNEERAGGHAVSLIGWGTDEAGVDYWLLQNSWGDDWGEKGFFRMRRGTNECGIEEGMIVATPEEPSFCAATECEHGGVAMKDCTCRCHDGWSGPTCSHCALTCHNGGVLDGCQCDCPPGTFGPDCSGSITLSTSAVCTAEAPAITAQLTFGGLSKPPTQKSFIGIYPEGSYWSTAYVNMAYVCGSSYDHGVNGGLCGTSVTVTLPTVSGPGTYDIALTKWLPLNEFDQDGWVGHVENVFGKLTITSDCSEAALSAAAAANDLKQQWQTQTAQRAAAKAAAITAMEARLKDAAAVLEGEESQPEPTLSIAGLDASNPVLFVGTPLSLCWTLPPALNFHPKKLMLFVGGGDSGSYYRSGLTGYGPDVALPDAAAGCVDSAIPSWIPDGQYTVLLKHQESYTVIAASPTFNTATVWVGVTTYSSWSNKDVQITIKWRVSGTTGSVMDTVRVLDSKNQVFDWFYTSCNCKGPPGASPVIEGSTQVKMIHSADVVTGGYAVKFYPGGQDVVADEAYDWVPWIKLGW